jgi:hypothetical protein
MSKDIYVNVQRVNATDPALSNVYMQLDNLPLSEVLYYEGVAPVEPFAAYTLGIYDIRQTDILIDTANIDPATNANYRYRVISVPEPFPDFHMELNLDLLRGSM